MFQLTYLFVALFAVAASALAMRRSVEWMTRFLSALFATAGWGVWSLESMSVQVETSAGVISQEYLSLAALGAVAAVVMLLVTVQYAMQALGESKEEPGPLTEGVK